MKFLALPLTNKQKKKEKGKKTAIFKNITLIFFYFHWYQYLSLYKKECLHNLCMNHALLDRESLDHASWTSTTLFTVWTSASNFMVFWKHGFQVPISCTCLMWNFPTTKNIFSWTDILSLISFFKKTWWKKLLNNLAKFV